MITDFQKAIEACSGSQEHVDLSVQLAEIYRRDLNEPSEDLRREIANRIVDDMVSANPTLVAAWIGRYLLSCSK